MASEYAIREALKNTTETYIGRKLTEQEVNTLFELFKKAEGTTDYARATAAIMRFAAIEEPRIWEKKSSSENLDRIMQDLKRELSK